jgi:hypothetical protein
MNISPTPPPLPRSRLLTALAWAAIGLGALVIPISVIAALMVIAGHPGSRSAEPLGALAVFAGPALVLGAGIGLLRRQRWAWWIMVGVLGAIVVSNVWTMIAVETGPSHYISPAGVPTTVLKSRALYLSPFVIVSGLSLAFLLTRRIRTECGVNAPKSFRADQAPPVVQDAGRGWRVGHVGRDQMYYEERHDGAWQRIDLSGEMLTGRAHHVIYFRSPERWQEYPTWARHRREEIIARIKREFREPDYEYSAAAIASADAAAQHITPPLPSTTHRSTRPSTQGMGALILFIVIFLLLAAGMSWLVWSGLGNGETWFPTKRAAHTRTVSRAQEPAIFWTAIGLYAAIGVGSVGFAGWLAKEGVRLARR